MTLALKEQDSKLSPQRTWIPIGAAVAGLAMFFWAGVSYSEIIFKLDLIASKQDQQAGDSVSIKMLRQWLELFKAKNTDIVVPDFPK